MRYLFLLLLISSCTISTYTPAQIAEKQCYKLSRCVGSDLDYSFTDNEDEYICMIGNESNISIRSDAPFTDDVVDMVCRAYKQLID